ncbi:UNVERIFIED_CONTAM: hypothetical protein OHV15_14575 [Microbacterium sp. SLM126]
MTLWARSRAVWVVLLAAASAAATWIFFRDVTVIIPDLRHGSTTPTPVAVLVCAVPALASAYSLSRKWHALEIRNRRGVWWIDVALTLLAPAMAGCVLLTATDEADRALLLTALRTSITLTGVVLLACSLLPAAWASVPALVWLVAAAVLGRSGESYDAWAWPANFLESDVITWIAAFIVVGLGAALYGTQQHPTRWEGERG